MIRISCTRSRAPFYGTVINTGCVVFENRTAGIYRGIVVHKRSAFILKTPLTTERLLGFVYPKSNPPFRLIKMLLSNVRVPVPFTLAVPPPIVIMALVLLVITWLPAIFIEVLLMRVQVLPFISNTLPVPVPSNCRPLLPLPALITMSFPAASLMPPAVFSFTR